MRRGTLITLIVLFAILSAAAIYQIVLATRDQAPLPGPREPGDLPTLPAAVPSPDAT